MNKFSIDKDNYIIINYHYIRNPSDESRGINSCSIDEFEKQIKYLSDNFKIVSIPEVFKSAQERIKGKFCAISFDDCFKDVYTNALPVMNKYGINATIFLISSVLERKLPSAHKLHILLSKFTSRELIDKFNKLFNSKIFIPKNKRIYKDRRLDDDILTANLKEILILISPSLKDDFINSVFETLGFDEAKIIDDFFMNSSEIKSLCSKGFILGNHSYSHNNLSSLSIKDIKKDIKKSKKIMHDFFGSIGISNIFSYPSGRWNKNVLGVLSKEKFKYGLTIKEKPVSCRDNALLIPRYDTNNLRDFLNKR